MVRINSQSSFFHSHAKKTETKNKPGFDLNEGKLKFLEYVEKKLLDSNQKISWSNALKAIRYDEMSNDHLISCIHFLKKKNEGLFEKGEKKNAYIRLVFEIENEAYTRAWHSLKNKNELVDACRFQGDHKLADALNNLSENSQTLAFNNGSSHEPNETKTLLSQASMEQVSPATSLDLNLDKPRVLVASLEYLGANVGGVGSVATELLSSMNQENQDARIITPLYNTYITDYHDKLDFVGIVEHPFQGKWIQSSIYSTKTQNDTVTQYFIKPPKTHLKINDIGTSKDVYASNDDTYLVNRSLYTTSAATAFASSYVGKDKKSPFQVLHTNAWILGFAGDLLTQHYNKMRKNAGLNCRLAHVAHVHGTGYSEQGIGLPSTIFDDLGLAKPNGIDRAQVNMQANIYRSSDCDILVSEWAANSSMTPEGGYGLDRLVKEKAAQGRLFGIRNGIARKAYDPTLKSIYSEFAFKQSIIHNIDVTDYTSQRNKAKEKLFEEKIIPSATKPLFLYVGRFDSGTKGVEALPAIVEQIHSEGGQCVVMGVLTGDPEAEKAIKKLIKFQEKHPETVKVYTNYEQDQKAFLNGTTIQKGKLIRLASDIVIIPSHKEADGLVPKEALTCGSLLMTSNVEGLSDTTRGLGDTWKGKKITKEDFNGFTYQDSKKYKENAKKTVTFAMKFFNEATVQEKNTITARLIKDSEAFDWKESIAKINTVYKKAIEERTETETSGMKIAEKKFYRRHFSVKIFAKTILRKIKNCLKQIFAKIIAFFQKIKRAIFAKRNKPILAEAA